MKVPASAGNLLEELLMLCCGFNWT